MDNLKLEDLVGEMSVSTTQFSVKPYLKDFFGGLVFGAIVNTVGQYTSPSTPLSTGLNFFSSTFFTGLSAVPPFRRLYDQNYIKTGQNVWGGRLTRFTGIFTGLSLAYYFLR